METTEVNIGISVEDRIDLLVNNLRITDIKSGGEWLPVNNPDTLVQNDTFRLKFRVDNLGEAVAQMLQVTPDSSWIENNSVCIYLQYDTTTFHCINSADTLIIPLDQDFSLEFLAADSNSGDIDISVLTERVRDANSYQNPVVGINCQNNSISLNVLPANLSLDSLWLTAPCDVDSTVSTELVFQINGQLSWDTGINESTIAVSLTFPASDDTFLILSSQTVQPDSDRIFSWFVKAPNEPVVQNCLVTATANDLANLRMFTDSDTIQVAVEERCRASLFMDYDESESLNTQNGTASTADSFIVDIAIDLNDINSLPNGSEIYVDLSYPDGLVNFQLTYDSSFTTMSQDYTDLNRIKSRSRQTKANSTTGINGLTSPSTGIIDGLTDTNELSVRFVTPDSLAAKICFWTGENPFGPEFMQAVIDESSLPYDPNSLSFPSPFAAKIAVDTSEVQFSIRTEKALEIVIDSLYISSIRTDSAWAQPINPDTFTTGSDLRLPVLISNNGVANAQVLTPGDTVWNNLNSVYTEFIYSGNMSFSGSSDTLLLPLGIVYNAVFTLDTDGDCYVEVKILSDLIRDENSYKHPPQLIKSKSFYSISSGAPLIEFMGLQIDPDVRNKIDYSIQLTSTADSPIKFLPNPQGLILTADSLENDDILTLIQNVHYYATVDQSEELLLPGQPMICTWHINLLINQNTINFDSIFVQPDITKPSQYLDLSGSISDTISLDQSAGFDSGLSIAPPYIAHFYLFPLAPGQTNSASRRELAAYFNEEIVFDTTGYLPQDIFESTVYNFFDAGSHFTDVSENMIYFDTKISDSLFVNQGVWSQLKSDVRLYLKQNIPPGVLTDLDGNNAIGRVFYQLPENSLTPIAYENTSPVITFISGEPTDGLTLRYRLIDLPADNFSGVLYDSIHVQVYETDGVAITDTLEEPQISYRLFESLDQAGPNLTVILDYYQTGTDLRIRITATDNSNNSTALVHDYSYIPVQNVETMIYPSPWDPEESLYIQYSIDAGNQPASDPALTIYNTNGDLVVDLGTGWINAVLYGPENPREPGVHRYLMNTEKLKKLPNGVYIISFNPHFSDKSAFPLNVLKSAPYYRSNSYGTQ